MQSAAFEIVQQYDIVEEWVKTWHMRDTVIYSQPCKTGTDYCLVVYNVFTNTYRTHAKFYFCLVIKVLRHKESEIFSDKHVSWLQIWQTSVRSFECCIFPKLFDLSPRIKLALDCPRPVSKTIFLCWCICIWSGM